MAGPLVVQLDKVSKLFTYFYSEYIASSYSSNNYADILKITNISYACSALIIFKFIQINLDFYLNFTNFTGFWGFGVLGFCVF